jgi:hypothetical protein
MVQSFVDLINPAAAEVLSVWRRYDHLLREAHGIFALEDPSYEITNLPGNREFGDGGYLRSWMASNRLLLVQGHENPQHHDYAVPIFCDTNFVSYCRAYRAGTLAGVRKNEFRLAIEFLKLHASSLNALPYLLENGDDLSQDSVRDSLIAFALLKIHPAAFLEKPCDSAALTEAEQIADSTIETTTDFGFRSLHDWSNRQVAWADVVLTKAALIGFDPAFKSVKQKLHSLLEFLHQNLARLPQFEVSVAYRFFALRQDDRFFNPVQKNASDLESKLHGMAWDLAHWRTIIDFCMINSYREGEAAFPIPHFLSFDGPFVELTEGFRLFGLIYAAGRPRAEQIYGREFLAQISEAMEGECEAEFYSDAAIVDRKSRALSGDPLHEQVTGLRRSLSAELNLHLSARVSDSS